MNRLAALAVVGAMSALMIGAAQATDVGVSIGFSQPGVYGRIDIGRFPQPALVVSQPVVVVHQPVYVAQPVAPMYLWVPQGHRKNWRAHCGQYGACGAPVYFVQHGWYQQHVMQRSRDGRRDHDDDDDRHDGGQGKGHGNGKNKGHKG